jgi:hypothetical protein
VVETLDVRDAEPVERQADDPAIPELL